MTALAGPFHVIASTDGADPCSRVCSRRLFAAELIATSRAAVADGATPVLPEPRWALPTNSPQDDDARYADSATALSVRSCSITTGRPHRGEPGFPPVPAITSPGDIRPARP
jgi:hypothetical protein